MKDLVAHRQAEADLAEGIGVICGILEKSDITATVPSLPEPRPGSRLAELSSAFGLDVFERGLLLIGAALELQPGVDALLARRNGGDTRPWPTPALAMALLPEPQWRAFLPVAPLRASRLVRLGPGDVLVERPVRLDERILHHLMGWDYLEPELARRLQPLRAPSALPLPHRDASLCLRESWARGERLHLWSEEPGAGLAVAADAAGERTALRLPAKAVPTAPDELEEFLALWHREHALQPLALVIDLDDAAEPGSERAARELALRADGPVVTCGHDPRAGDVVTRIRVPAASFEERLAHWRDALAGLPEPAGLDEIVARFLLDGGGVDAAVASLRQGLERDAGADARQLLWDGARVQAHPRLEDLAQRLPALATWDRFVMPEAQMRMLRALLAQARHKAVVDHGWGFAQTGGRGNGTSAVFAGASGTGKTMAAEVLAQDLGLDLFRIDLSAVVSKYIGETEKNLRRVFDAAESGGAVLLFDEADALFGKRTEVRDSHDRHANIEVSYLLQRMESYNGLAILTTNYRKHLDDAFLGRIPFVIEFPLPDAALRERIWHQVFPPNTPVEGLDPPRLARLAVSGRSIRSIARNAAFLAADAQEPVRMKHLRWAAELEAEKLGRSLTPSEVRGWS